MRTIENILADELPQDPAIWETFAQVFFAFMQIFCDPVARHTSEGLFELTETPTPPLGPMRKVPLLKWDQIDQMVARERAASAHPC